MADCIFCKIVAGELPADVVLRTDSALAFRDLNPQAPTHVLVIPLEHVEHAGVLRPEHAELLSGVFAAANAVAEQDGIAERGYRLVFNVGEESGNSVPHLHLHVLGGRFMSWPRGSGPVEERAGTLVSPVSTAVKILVPGNHLMVGLLGQRDELLRLVEQAFGGVDIHVRGNEISVSGEGAETVGRLFEELVTLLEAGQVLDTAHVGRTIDMVKADERPTEVLTAEVLRGSRGRTVRPKTSGQKRYVDAIRDNVITFGIGPAGTGKSWLAVATAVQALQAKTVNRIILTRPAVEAGERLGFLPGDLMAKVDPYLRPLFDALYDMVEPDGAQRLLDRGAVEVAPLAFMRGRTLNDSFIILDEAQNTTPEQMKMFLTRLGFGSKAVVTGDITQIDVPQGRSGLVDLEPVLSDIDGVAFIRLTNRDVVRHKIVQDIVDAYERASTAASRGTRHKRR